MVFAIGAIVLITLEGKGHARAESDTAMYRVGCVAERLGMRVERGSPDFNLVVNPPVSGDYRVDILLRGDRRGVPIELVFIREMRFERDFVSKVHRAWEARLTAFPTARFGRFEAFRRAATSRSAIRRCLLGRH